MGKYQMYQSNTSNKRKEMRTHPVWRGIGFALLILTPILGYAGSVVLVNANKVERWVAFPTDLYVKGADSYLFIKILLAVVLMFIIYGIFQLLTFFLYRIFGPSRYGPLDVPPVRYKGKKTNR
jgi:hypothetical protein